MFGLTYREFHFALVIGSAHFIQHFLKRLVPPLIPVLALLLEYPLWQLGLLISILALGGGIAQAPLGVLSDRFDRLYILPTGIVLAGGSYVVFSLAPHFEPVVPTMNVLGSTFEGGFIIMCAAMLGVGLGAAVVHPTGYPLISANIEKTNKGKVLGAFGSSAKFGGATAPFIIGILIIVLIWEQIVLLLGLLVMACGILLFFALRSDNFDTLPQTTDVDSIDTPDAVTIDEEAITADRRTYLYPLVIIYAFFVTKMFASNGLNAFLPVFIVGVYAYSVELSGTVFGAESVANFYFTALLLSAALSQLLIGGLTDRYDARKVILACLLVATVALATLAAVDLSPLVLLAIIVILGASLWGTNPARDSLISNIAPPSREGRTFGYIWTAVHLTGALIPVIIGYIIDVTGFRAGFLLLALGTVLAFVTVSLLFVDRLYVAVDYDALPEADSAD